ncbi:hypothetical protein FAZ15_07175 [Sphingobacterium olei]|uniref:Cardiolipin synthase N-terminal domain-containing protein n=1 Tax=Sphingobacterium olei TaxID=2571155 RepID=A0A4U0P4T2_9SPHI|nr:hypothetical protein FAZ15_07175 [Sphingobacterium olei]
MKLMNLFHQTKEAFLFSLVFYIIGILLLTLKVSFAPFIFSVSLLISLIWVFMVLREIMLSPYIDPSERIMLTLFIVFLNIIGGIVYFYFIRERVIQQKGTKK